MVRQQGRFPKTCERCGSQYEVVHWRYPANDNYPDIKCEVCCCVLIPGERNTTHDYSPTLVRRAEWPKPEEEK